jgi:8-oxo-dGTP diphosphatase
MKLATLCYLKRDDHTLMLYRHREGDYHRGKWNGLGGKLEPGESPEDCVRREVKEESGLEVKVMRLKGVITFPLFDGLDDWYVFVYTVPGFGGEMVHSLEGALHWIPDDRLLELNLWPGDRIFLPWLGAGRFFSAKFTYEEGRLVDHEVSFYPPNGYG